MKNNMVLMMAAIVAIFALVVALYGASATLLGQSPPAQPGVNNSTAIATPADEQSPALIEDVNTAFGALAVSSADPAVKAWMTDKKIVYVASISSDFCEAGLSDTWTICLASDDGQIVASVIDGVVTGIRESRSSPQQGLDPSKAIDSAEIWQDVADNIISSGGKVPETASMSLKVTGGKPCWDVSYKATDGLHIMRVDAVNGTVTDQVTIGQG